MSIDISFAAAAFLTEVEGVEMSFGASSYLTEVEGVEISFAASSYLAEDAPAPSGAGRRLPMIHSF